jgi:hypothetical protein
MALRKTKAKTDAAAREKEMLDLLKSWKELEDITIKSCDSILNKSKNQIIKTITTSIKNDSAKHKAIIQIIQNSITKEGYVISPDDLMGVSTLLNKHMEYEQKSITIAKKALAISRDAITKQLLNIILEDEKKHKLFARQMNELKFRVSAKVT